MKLTPLIFTLTGLMVGAAPENGWPGVTAGFVGPKPVPNTATLSPGFAATVGYPSEVPVGPMMSYVPPPYAPVPFDRKMMPATCVASRRKNSGLNAARVVVDFAEPATLVTTICTGPVAVSAGASRLIRPGLA